MFPKLFGAVAAPHMLELLMPVAQEWKPDLLVHEASEFAAPIVAANLGIPHVTQGFGTLFAEEPIARAGEEVAHLWRGFGLDPVEYGGSYEYLYLDIWPPSMRLWVEQWVDQTDVVRRAGAVVCHGGSGTVLAALSLGVPMVIVPLFADQPYNAESRCK